MIIFNISHLAFKYHSIMATSPIKYVSNGFQDCVKCCIKTWGHLHLRSGQYATIQKKGVVVGVVVVLVVVVGGWGRGISGDGTTNNLVLQN